MDGGPAGRGMGTSYNRARSVQSVCAGGKGNLPRADGIVRPPVLLPPPRSGEGGGGERSALPPAASPTSPPNPPPRFGEGGSGHRVADRDTAAYDNPPARLLHRPAMRRLSLFALVASAALVAAES